MLVRYFKTPQDFRQWLAGNHSKADELWVGYFKKATGKSSITWPDSVDQALCFGWIKHSRPGEVTPNLRWAKKKK